MVSQLLAYAADYTQQSATSGFEYSYQSSGQLGLGGWLFFTALMLALFYGWYLLDKRLNGKHPFWMFIPILNVIELFRLGDVSPKKLLWIFLPILGAFIVLYYEIKVLINICHKAGHSGWMVLLMFVPVLGYFFPYFIMPKEK